MASADTADFLVELGTEELPPQALLTLSTALTDGIGAGLAAAGLEHAGLTAFATLRRLAVMAEALQSRQAPSEVEKRGPPVRVAFDKHGLPSKAAQAFASGCGVAVDQLERLSTEKGEWLVHRSVDPGRTAVELLPDIVNRALADLPIPKRMRWGDSEAEFVRPVHWLLMLFDGQVVPAMLVGRRAGDLTRGHRFHAPAELLVPAPADYEQKLATDGYVIASFARRRDQIARLVRDAAEAAGGEPVLDPAVLDEVTALVEWPVAVTGRFDAEFLDLPEEVLVSTLQAHQRYFPVREQDGQLMPLFIAISNLESREPEKVVAGNERVIRPRLADAAFFWNKDRQTPLIERRDALKDVVFQRDLGSLYDKSERVATLAHELVDAEHADGHFEHGVWQEWVVRAAHLAKTDLLTEMVGEFPDLQGRMGYYYALADDEADAVAVAIEEQYLPRHAGDQLPQSPVGQTLSIADRLDTLAGIFAVGKKPTGNKDPFALRRAALGLLRILIECDHDLDLRAFIGRALVLQPKHVSAPGELAEQLFEFITDRLRAYYLDGQCPAFERGEITAEVFEAIHARRPGSPSDFHARLRALREFLALDAAESLAAANKRIANILRGTDEHETDLDPTLFAEDAEKQLHTVVDQLAATQAERVAARDYRGVLLALAGLREPVDRFFDDVMVMVEDDKLRRNRLALLRRLRDLFLDVADLSVIPAT